MAILRRAGLVTAQKRGRWTFYRRNDEVLETAAHALAKRVDTSRALPRLRMRRASDG